MLSKELWWVSFNAARSEPRNGLLHVFLGPSPRYVNWNQKYCLRGSVYSAPYVALPFYVASATGQVVFTKPIRQDFWYSIYKDLIRYDRYDETTYWVCNYSKYFSQVDTLKEVRPKKFLAVPRVWEKIVERLQEAERNSTPTKRKLMRWALAKGRENSDLLLQHGSSHKATFGYKLAHRLILR